MVPYMVLLLLFFSPKEYKLLTVLCNSSGGRTCESVQFPILVCLALPRLSFPISVPLCVEDCVWKCILSVLSFVTYFIQVMIC